MMKFMSLIWTVTVLSILFVSVHVNAQNLSPTTEADYIIVVKCMDETGKIVEIIEHEVWITGAGFPVIRKSNDCPGYADMTVQVTLPNK